MRDSGLTHALLEIGPLNQLLGHPVVGPSWEGFVIENLIGAVGSMGTPSFYRTADGSELDLVFEKGGQPFIGIEIKRSTAPKIGQGFMIACDDLKIEHRIVVSSGHEQYRAKENISVHSLESAILAVRDMLRGPFA
jgi:uncharacterized protein